MGFKSHVEAAVFDRKEMEMYIPSLLALRFGIEILSL